MTMLPSLPTSLNMNRLGKTIEWLKGFKEYEEIMGGGGGGPVIKCHMMIVLLFFLP